MLGRGFRWLFGGIRIDPSPYMADPRLADFSLNTEKGRDLFVPNLDMEKAKQLFVPSMPGGPSSGAGEDPKEFCLYCGEEVDPEKHIGFIESDNVICEECASGDEDY